MIFYMCHGTDQLTDGEKKALHEQLGIDDFWGDCSKMTDAELDAYLLKYMGIEMEPSMAGKHLHYLEEYDTYYFFHTDANGMGVFNLYGWMTKDGRYLLRSVEGHDDFIVVLTPTKDGFFIYQLAWTDNYLHE